MSFPALRKRIVAQPVVSAASGTLTRPLPARIPPQKNVKVGVLARLQQGLFGNPNPVSYTQSAQVAVPGKKAFYHYTEGDQFTAGSPSFVFEPTQELTPIYPFWGRSFLVKESFMLARPFQPPQIESQATIVLAGLGGLQAGQFVTQPLEESEGAGI